jgi:large subunit ribosomal protein L24
MAAAVKRPKLKVKKGDTVIVTTGRDKGKRGEILKVIPAELRVVVQGVNVVKRHTRPSPRGQGGIVEKEAPIHVSNVAHIDPKDDKPSRVGFKTLDDGRKVRFAKRSGEIIDR